MRHAKTSGKKTCPGRGPAKKHYKQSFSQDKPGCRQYSRAAARSARIRKLSRSNSEQGTSMQNSQGREFRFRVRYPFHRAGDFLEVACININEVFADSPRSIRAAAAMELPGTSKLAAVNVVDSPSQSPGPVHRLPAGFVVIKTNPKSESWYCGDFRQLFPHTLIQSSFFSVNNLIFLLISIRLTRILIFANKLELFANIML